MKNKKIVYLYGLFALISCICLNYGALRDYAYRDVYEFIWSAHHNPKFINVFVQGGRPLYGLLSQFAFGTIAEQISDLKWIRLSSILFSGIFSAQLFYFLIKNKFKKNEAGLFAFLVLILPSFSVYANWAATFQIPIALNLSLFAGILLLNNSKNHLLNNLFSILLIIISLCLYQPAATVFLVPSVISVTIQQTVKLKHLIQLFLVFCLSFGLYFLIFKISLQKLELSELHRSGIDFFKLPKNFSKFYFSELKRLLYASGLLIKKKTLLRMGFLPFIGFFLLFFKRSSKFSTTLLLLFFLIAIIPVPYLPNLLSIDRFTCNRTMAPSAIIVLFYQFYFLRELSSRYNLARWISLVFAIFYIALGALNSNYYFSGIQSREYTAVRSSFHKIDLDGGKKVILLRPSIDFLQASAYYNYADADEFGQISSSQDWVPIPFLKQVIKEKANSQNYNLPLIETYSIDSSYDSNGALIVNLEEILHREFSN